jgi:hypothetical protein
MVPSRPTAAPDNNEYRGAQALERASLHRRMTTTLSPHSEQMNSAASRVAMKWKTPLDWKCTGIT